jgi:hypothetical protein
MTTTSTERAKLERDSRQALRAAWPHRHTSFRAPIVVRCNVAMLRKLKAATG